MRILMIDDNPFFVRHLERMCAERTTAEGGAWASAGTPQEGLAEVNRLLPELVLLDPAMPEGGAGLEGYLRELVDVAAPSRPGFLLLTSPVHEVDDVLQRLSADGGANVGSLAKPFDLRALDEKITSLFPVETPSNLTIDPMPDPAPSPPAGRFAWLSTAPEVTGYAHLSPEGTVQGWSGEEKDQGPHSALVYFLRLAGLCGEELGLGRIGDVQTAGPGGCGMSVNLRDGGALNVLATTRVNLRAIATRVGE